MRRKKKDQGEPDWMGPLPASPGCDCQICRPEDAYDQVDRRTIDTVLRHGWQVLVVSDEDPCTDPAHDHEAEAHPDPGPGFAYTLGLGHRAGHPELLMSGLPAGLMHRALNDLAERVLAGRRFAAGDVLEGVLAGWPVVLEEVSEEGLREAVPWSGWFHRRRPEALMVVWPSSGSGLFPWQPGVAEVVVECQPAAWRVPMVHGGGVATDPGWVFPVPADRLVYACRHIVEDGDGICWVARESDDERGEDWSFVCASDEHDVEEDLCLLHLPHVVRHAPSVRLLGDLPMDHEAERDGVDAEWVVTPLGPGETD